MRDEPASSVIARLLAVELGATGQDASNRFSVEGVTLGSNADGALVIGIRRLEVAALRLALTPFVVEVGRFAVRGAVAQVRFDGGTPHLHAFEAAEAELSDVQIHGPLSFSRELKDISQAVIGPAISGDTATGESGGANAWSLGPLAAMDGRIRAEIVDAHLLFDADVTVPIRRGSVDFNEATVEHVGPDSSMGVSRLGIYVDAPNGRSYVYQFSTTPIGGVEFERRSGLLGAWVAHRGNLQLQAFTEGLLRQASGGPGAGFTEDARLMFNRTALSGDLELGDGVFAAPGLAGELVGRAEGHNAIRLHSKAVGRGLTAEMPALSVRHALLNARGRRLTCEGLTGTLLLRLLAEGRKLRFEFELPNIRMSRLRVDRGPAEIE